MIVELYGLPGSGKSYLFSKIKGKNIKLVQTPSLLKKGFLGLWYSIKHPHLAFQLLKHIFIGFNSYKKANTLRLFLYKVSGSYFGVLSKLQICSRNKNKICFIDEGLYQLSFSSYDSMNKNLKESLNLANSITSKVILVNSSAKIRESRMKSRNDFPRSEYGKEYLKEWHKNQEKVNSNIVKYIKGQNHLEINNLDSNLKKNLNDIIKFVTK